MQEEDIKALLEKYKAGTITDAEKAVLDQWYLQVAADNSQELSEAERLQTFDSVQQHLEALTAAKPVRRLWLRIAAAACLLIGLSFGGYLLLHKPQPAQQITQQQPDVQPGHNQATLTLANGQKIVLTKGLKGQLATQHGTIISADNNISYDAKANEQVSYNTLATAQGEQSPYPLVLADGTKVWLNAESSITFPTAFNGKKRNVTLTGEAYFEVAHNSKQPFKVEANGQTIEDIGTAFNVNAYTNEPVFKTTLVEGSIKINNITLIPGQQAKNTNGTIKVISDVNTKVYTAWKDGYFRYELETLPEIMREFARWYKVDVVFATPPTDQQFNMKVSRKATLNRALQILANGGIRYKLEGSKLIINP